MLSDKLEGKLARLKSRHAELNRLIDDRTGSPEEIKRWKKSRLKIKDQITALESVGQKVVQAKRKVRPKR